MTSCIGKDEMQQLLDDSLDERGESRITEHLEACEDCRNALKNLAVDGESFDAFEEELNEFGSTLVNGRYTRDTNHELSTAQSVLNASDDSDAMGRLGRFDVFSIIGIGSTGFVYKAFDRSLHRPVALKLLSPALAHLVASRQRFEREGRAIALVRDPHVVDVYGVETHGDLPIIVMRYVAGQSLQRRIERSGELTSEEVVRIGVQIAKGLAAAHAQGIIHRDIKPANILMESGSDRAIVSDFGLAHVAGDIGMTRTGMIAGTPQYMSPEQADGRVVDSRSDLFSLGCVLYACCTGEPPFKGGTLIGVLRQVAEMEPPTVRTINPSVAPWLEAFIAKLMAKSPEDRFQTADEVAVLLSEELAHLQSSTTQMPMRNWLVPESRARRKSIYGVFVVMAISICLFLGTFVYYSLPATRHADQRFQQYASFEPTSAELSIAAAKAAYDLSYETHTQEASLSGDMKESKARHLKALDLAYDPARTCYHLARANALEGRADEAFQWFESALKAGFCDSQALEEPNRDLRRIRNDGRFTALRKRVADSEVELDLIKKKYFVEANYSAALELAKERLDKWPEDELAILLIAGALTELAFEDARQIPMAKIWNEKIRSSVRYANFGSYNLGCLALMEGRLQEAFDRLNFAISTGFTDRDHLVNDHMLNELVSDPRYVKLLGRFEEQ